MQVMLCQSDLILLHKWGLDDSQSHTTVGIHDFCWIGCRKFPAMPRCKLTLISHSRGDYLKAYF